MANLTVKQLAKELGVSKQAIHKRINQLPVELTPEKVGGAYELSSETADYIKGNMERASTTNQQSSPKVDSEVDTLRLMIKELKEEKTRLYTQLEIKDKQLDKMHKLVDQQQQLTLQSNHQTDRLQLEFFQEKKDDKNLSTDSSPKKKWWHFGF